MSHDKQTGSGRTLPEIIDQLIAWSPIDLPEHELTEVQCRAALGQCFATAKQFITILDGDVHTESSTSTHHCQLAIWAYLAEIVHIIKRRKPRSTSASNDLAWNELMMSLVSIIFPLSTYRSELKKEDSILRLLLAGIRTGESKYLHQFREHLQTHTDHIKSYQFYDTRSFKASVTSNLEILSGRAGPPGAKATHNQQRSANQYDLFQASDSLMRILRYLQIARGTDTADQGNANLGRLAVERAIQVTGEYLKSSSESNHLPKYLCDKIGKEYGVPIEAISRIRDKLSHSNLLLTVRRARLDSCKGSHQLFEAVRKDLGGLRQILSRVLFHDVQIQLIVSLLAETEDTESVGARIKQLKNLKEMEDLGRQLHVKQIDKDLACQLIQVWKQQPCGDWDSEATLPEVPGINSLLAMLSPNSLPAVCSEESATVQLCCVAMDDDDFLLDLFVSSLFDGILSRGTRDRIMKLKAGFDIESITALMQPTEQLGIKDNLATATFGANLAVAQFISRMAEASKVKHELTSAVADECNWKRCRVAIKKLEEFVDAGYYRLATQALDRDEITGKPVELTAISKRLLVTDPFPALQGAIKLAYFRIPVPMAMWDQIEAFSGRHYQHLYGAIQKFNHNCESITNLFDLLHKLQSESQSQFSAGMAHVYALYARHQAKNECARLVKEEQPDLARLSNIGGTFSNTPLSPTVKSVARWVENIPDPFAKFLSLQNAKNSPTDLLKSVKELFVITTSDGGRKKTTCVISNDDLNLLSRVYKERECDALERHLGTSLDLLDMILLGAKTDTNGISEEMRHLALNTFQENAQVQSAVELLLLDLSETLRCIGKLLGCPNLEEVLTLINPLQGSPLQKHFLVRNYLAHGDAVLDSLDLSLQQSVVNNALDFIDKGRPVVQVARLYSHGNERNMQLIPYWQEVVRLLDNDQLPNSGLNSVKFNLIGRYGPEFKHSLLQAELLDAVRRGDLQKVQLLEGTQTINSILKSSPSRFHNFTTTDYSILYNNFQVFQHLVSKSDTTSIDGATHMGGITTLHIASACHFGHQFAGELLRRGANVQAVTRVDRDFGRSPLQVAACSNSVAIAELLCEAGAIPDTTCVRYGVSQQNIEMIDLLLLYNAPVNESSVRTQGAEMSNLEMACSIGNEEIVSRLVDAGAYLERKTASGATPLGIAVYNGHLPVVRMLIKRGANVHDCGRVARPLLHTAIESAQPEMIAYVAREVGDREHFDAHTTAGHLAVKEGNIETVRIVFEEVGLDLEAVDDWGRTPLYVAIWRGDIQVIDFLIRQGANLRHEAWTDFYDVPKPTPFVLACSSTLPIVQRLAFVFQEGGGMDLSQLPEMRWKCMFIAVRFGKLDIMQYLLELGSPPACRLKWSHNGVQPLMLAAANGHFAMVEWHVSRRLASVTNPDNKGWSCLHYACQAGQLQIVQLLVTEFPALKECAEPCPVLTAIKANKISVTKYLLSKGLHLRNSEGYTELYQAVCLGSDELVKVHLNQDLDKPAPTGYSPLQLAAKAHDWTIVRLLLEAGADANVMDADKCTPVQRAMEVGNQRMLEVFINIHINYVDGLQNILMLAIRGKHLAAFDYLLSRPEFVQLFGHSDVCSLVLSEAFLFGFYKGVNSLVTIPELLTNFPLPELIWLLLNHSVPDTIPSVHILIDKLPNSFQGSDFCRLVAESAWALYPERIPVLKHLLTRSGHFCLHSGHRCVQISEYIRQGEWDAVRFLLQHGAPIPPHADLEHVLLSQVDPGTDEEVIVQLIRKLDYTNAAPVSQGRGVDLPACGDNLLHFYVRAGKLGCVRALLNCHGHAFNVRDCNRDGDCIQLAINKNQHVVLAELLLRFAPTEHLVTDLEEAIPHGECLQLLLNKCPVDMNEEFKETGETFFMVACTKDTVQLPTLQWLVVSRGANPSQMDKLGRSALHHVAARGDLSTARWLVDVHGLDVNAVDHAQDAPLTLLLKRYWKFDHQAEFAHFLFVKGANLNVIDGEGKSALQLAIEANLVATLRILLSRGADFRSKYAGEPLLIIAARKGRLSALKLLVRKYVEVGLDLNECVGHEGETILHHTASFGNVRLVQFLLNHGMDRNRQDDTGKGALHHAVIGRGNDGTENLELIVLLLKAEGAGTSINLPDNKGRTPLHLAADWSKPRTLDLLLEHGGDDTMLTTEGHSVCDIVRSRSRLKERHSSSPELLKQRADACIGNDLPLAKTLIESRNVNPELVCPAHQTTPLHLAVRFNHSNLVTYLLRDVKMNVNVEDGDGWQAIAEAGATGNRQLFRLLVDAGSHWRASMTTNRKMFSRAMSDWILEHLNKMGDVAKL